VIQPGANAIVCWRRRVDGPLTLKAGNCASRHHSVIETPWRWAFKSQGWELCYYWLPVITACWRRRVDGPLSLKAGNCATAGFPSSQRVGDGVEMGL